MQYHLEKPNESDQLAAFIAQHGRDIHGTVRDGQLHFHGYIDPRTPPRAVLVPTSIRRSSLIDLVIEGCPYAATEAYRMGGDYQLVRIEAEQPQPASPGSSKPSILQRILRWVKP